MEWLALIIPILAVIALLVFFSKKMSWWEFFIPLIAGIITIALGKSLVEAIVTHDTEYWGGWITHATYYEFWNERVPCSHAVYRTEYYECGDSKQSRTCSREVFDHWAHPYDVDDHPPYWEIQDSNGITININQDKFENLAQIFNSRQFVDMHRDYHTVDGDSYVAIWPGSRSTMQPVTTTHSYTNRVANAKGIYQFPDIDKKKVKVFDYPDGGPFSVPSVLSDKRWPGTDDLDKVNASLGASKKVRIWVVIFEGKDRQSAFDQQAYWKGGNKNELIVCIGVNSFKDPTVKWCEVFSWSNVEPLKTSIKGFVAVDNTTLNVPRLSEFLETEVTNKWTKINWHVYDFIAIQPPAWAMWMIWIVTILTTIGSCFFCITNSVTYENNETTIILAQCAWGKICDFFVNLWQRVCKFLVNINPWRGV